MSYSFFEEVNHIQARDNAFVCFFFSFLKRKDFALATNKRKVLSQFLRYRIFVGALALFLLFPSFLLLFLFSFSSLCNFVLFVVHVHRNQIIIFKHLIYVRLCTNCLPFFLLLLFPLLLIFPFLFSRFSITEAVEVVVVVADIEAVVALHEGTAGRTYATQIS